MSAPNQPRPRLTTVARAAKTQQKSPAAIYKWLHRGHIHAYRHPSIRGVLVDLNEIEEFVRTAPRGAVRRPYRSFPVTSLGRAR